MTTGQTKAHAGRLPQLAFAKSNGNLVAGATAPGTTFTELTAQWHADSRPTWSPDGQQIAFARSYFQADHERRELFRIEADGTGLQRLTDNSLLESWPAWSPDGSRLAFSAGDLYVMPITASGGGAPLAVTTGNLDPRNLAWSPDGTQLAFNSWSCGDAFECPAAELYVLTLAGNQLTRLTNNDHFDGDPAWSPDGTRLVYESGPFQLSKLYLIPPAGGAPTLLTTEGVGHDPAWSPDGSLIAYSYPYGIGATIHPDGSGKQLLDGYYNEGLTNAVWSADGQYLYYLETLTPCGLIGCGWPDYYWVKIDLDSTVEPQIVAYLGTNAGETSSAWSPGAAHLAYARNGLLYNGQQPLTQPVRLNGDPTWSPNGQALAVSSQWDYDYNIYALDADGRNYRALTTHPGNDWNPTWSAHDRIAFSSNRDGNWELYVMNADGSGQTNLTHTAAAEAEAAWSPDGNRLAFARQQGGNWDIYVMNEDGSNVVRLTTHPAADRYPTWSPDGHLAFQTDRDGNDEIYVLSLSGAPGSETNLTHTPSDEREPAWSPDGTEIAYSGDALPAGNGLYLMNTNGGGRQFLYDALSPQPAWQPAPANLTPRIWVPLVNR